MTNSRGEDLPESDGIEPEVFGIDRHENAIDHDEDDQDPDRDQKRLAPTRKLWPWDGLTRAAVTRAKRSPLGAGERHTRPRYPAREVTGIGASGEVT